MKKLMYVMLAILLVGSQMTLSAQNKENKGKKQRPTQEQMMKMQANQMVKALMLDDATAAKFVPVYENYLKELRECRTKNRTPRPSLMEGALGGRVYAQPDVKSVPTDAEVEKSIKDRFAQSRKMLDIREKYYNEFRKILSPKQIMKIYQMEKRNADKFKKEFNRRKQAKPHQGQKGSI